MPAFVAKALAPTKGACRFGWRFRISSTCRDDVGELARASSSETPKSKRAAYPSFSFSAPMSVTRLALPQRSPRPLSVPWMWRAPASTAASEFATAQPQSSWAWMPSLIARDGHSSRRGRSRSTSCGSVPPLVSHKTTQRAPASWAVPRAGERVDPDWPCSRRRNARNRRCTSRPRARAAATLSRMPARFSCGVVSSATRTW